MGVVHIKVKQHHKNIHLNEQEKEMNAMRIHQRGLEGRIQCRGRHRPRRAAVIGGGPSGIQAAGQLMKRNFQVTVFERYSQLGGIWCYEKMTIFRNQVRCKGSSLSSLSKCHLCTRI